MNQPIIFRLAARCEAAGRPNNEDNFLMDDNLSDNEWRFETDRELSLSPKGALLVVCDGMGGMNAGEVASAIAVDTIKFRFSTERLSDDLLCNDQCIERFIVEAIQAADHAIKEDGKQHPEHEGMGSTIVLAWLLNGKAYIGWCGDSRCYRFNPAIGLERLSHDHSYVQDLVDSGRLSEDLAFDHPNSNIITRSLGDPNGKARPDTIVYELCNGDIILLCSDGLCGCLRDKEIEAVMRSECNSLQQLRDALWQADEAAGWHDNVTIAMAQIVAGAKLKPQPALAQHTASASANHRPVRVNRFLITLLIVLSLLLCAAGCIIYRLYNRSTPQSEQAPETPIATTDNVGKADEPIVSPAPQESPIPAQTPSRIKEQATAEQRGAAVENQSEILVVLAPEPREHQDKKVEGVVISPVDSGQMVSLNSIQNQ